MPRTIQIIIFIIIVLSCQAYSSVLYSGTDNSMVSLTFDDGPSAKYSGRVLDILKAENVKATFFVVGKNIERSPEIMKRIVSDGHEIGNHTYSHTRITQQDSRTIMNEIEVTNYQIHRYYPKKISFFRPPHGYYRDSDRALIERSGYRFVLWSVNADDFYHDGWGLPAADVITKRVLKGVKGGGIILAHDSSEQLVTALPSIIHIIKARGYRFVTLSEMVDGPKLAAKKYRKKA